MKNILIVGSGLFGSVVARELTDIGYNCTIYDKREHVGGNCYTENVNGINVHTYGAHIFHTSNTEVWNYLNKHTTVNQFTLRMKLNFDGNVYSMPINLNTLNQIWGVTTPSEAKYKIEEVTKKYKKDKYENAEEWALGNVGEEIYNIFYKQYLEKQWQKDVKDIPVEIIARQVVRFSYDDNYFNDTYQGIPNYTKLFDSLLSGISVETNVDFFKVKKSVEPLFDKIIFTGPIDSYYEYKFGVLEYRSLKFEHRYIKNLKDFQGTSVMSYPETKYDYTRIIEHKHFEFGNQDDTIVTYEYPQDWNIYNTPYYPFNDKRNTELYKKYANIVNDKVIFGGRLGLYQYLNMDTTIAKALELVKTFKI